MNTKKIDDKIEKFSLSDLEFKSQKEYEAAENDLKKIKQILNQVDTDDPEQAARLYMLVRYRKLQFGTETMRSMLMRYLSDKISAQSISNQNNNAGSRSTTKSAREHSGRSRMATFFGTACIVAAFVLTGVFVYQQYLNNRSSATALELRELYHEDAQILVEENTGESADESAGSNTENKLYNTRLADLYSINRDLAGWIRIDGTSIDYPVVQAPDNEYYLNRNFYGAEDINGTLFLDCRNISDDDTNLLVYGHNRQNDSMFGSLTKYKQKEFFEENNTIQLDTLKGSYTYRIIAVCLGEVAYRKDNTFRYYNFTNADTNAALDAFFVNIKAHSMYPVDYTLKKTDHFLTLSTCSSYTENGRLYVVAVREE